MLYSLDDYVIVPSVTSKINSRSECNPYVYDKMYPIFTAPMSSVIDESNYRIFQEAGVNTIIPRNIALETRLNLIHETFIAMSLSEFEEIICNKNLDNAQTKYVCIDIANGHMERLLNLGYKAKSIHGNKLQLMAGNIANPTTYPEYAKAGFDYVRAGVGNGNACFIAGTKVTMANGIKKNIEDIDVGEQVQTISGSQKVISTFKKMADSTIVINNQVECTSDHKFLVINKKDKDKVNEDNLSEYSFYVEAKNLTSQYLLVEDKIV